MFKRMFLIAALSLPALTQAAIYQCTVNGQKVFSDTPCGKDATEITVDPVTVGGRLDTGTNIQTYKSPKRTQSADNDGCHYINSTDLNRYIIQKTIVRGMKPADVRRAWGSPSSISTGRITQWAYHYPGYSSNYVYFENGCVTNWSGYYR